MALWAIGDVQGCNEQFGELLTAINFSADRDQLWLVGDLVNRGPDSLGVLRRVRALGAGASVVLGNHDLHLLAASCGKARLREGDTLAPVLAAPDAPALLDWLAGCELMHEDAALGTCMVHAGLAPQWDLSMAGLCAREIEQALRGDREQFFSRLYGDEPDRWDPALCGEDRLRFMVNCFTRMRFVDADGRLMLKAKGSPKKMQGTSLIPWYEAHSARWRGARVVFGHWSTLGFFNDGAITALDTGCVWGDALTALRLDEPQARPVQVSCRL